MNDPISDMLTRIRNAQAVKKETVIIPFSKIKWSIAEILKENKFIDSLEKKGKAPWKSIAVNLKYENGEPVIRGLKRVSRPGQRVYVNAKNLKSVKSGFGISIVSTPSGIMTNLEAKKKNLGGELICEIW